MCFICLTFRLNKSNTKIKATEYNIYKSGQALNERNHIAVESEQK